MEDLIGLIGRFHVLLLHFPIASLVFLGLFRIIPALRSPKLKLAHASLWIITALSTLVSALTGWVLILNEGNDWGQLGTRHQWLGTALAILVTASCLVAFRGMRSLSDGGLALSCVLMVVTAHHGGSMSHGSDFLWGSATQPVAEVEASAAEDEAETGPDEPEGEPQIEAHIEAMVDPSLWADAKAVFMQHCIDCHNNDRQRGYFNISSHAEIFKGGSSGQVVIPGNAKASLLMKLTLLPEDNWDRMPPDGDPLNADELAVIRNWIRAGAPDENGQLANKKP
jgi:mono/diheme cytochrome c family protein